MGGGGPLPAVKQAGDGHPMTAAQSNACPARKKSLMTRRA